MTFDPPLKGRYWFTVTLVLLALVPDLLLSTAMTLLRTPIVAALHTTVPAFNLGETFSNAGWAFGAVLAADFFQRFGQRRPLLIYEAVFVLGSILGAVAPDVRFLIAGRILQGTATGMLLVAALPPLITMYPVARLTSTAAVTGLSLFGAVAAGPLLAGYVAYTGAWRWFFAAMALLGLLGFIVQFLAVEPKPAPNPGLRFDLPGIALTALGAGLTFAGVGGLSTYPWTSRGVWLPTALGLLAIVILLVLEYNVEDGLMPVKLLANTFPVIGIVSAIIAGLVFTGLTELFLLYVQRVGGASPLLTGLVFWPALVSAVAASLLFGRLFNTRYVLVLPLAGMLALLAVAWIMTTLTIHMERGELFWIAFLLGAGAGLTVSPGLFIAGLSVAPTMVGRAFSVIEMLRLAGAFALVPAFVYFAEIFGMAPQKLVLGMHIVFWVSVGLMVVTLASTTVLFFLGGARLHAPDLSAYLERQEEAFASPRLAEVARGPDSVGASIARGVRSILPAEDAGRDQEKQDRQARQGQKSGGAKET